MPLTPQQKQAFRALGQFAEERFDKYSRDRRQWEQRALKSVRQFKGKYDPEVEAELLKDPGASRVYPKLTRIKVNSFVAKLMELLFPATETNWDVLASTVPNISKETLQKVIDDLAEAHSRPPTDEEIERAVMKFAVEKAANMRREIQDQLAELGGSTELSYPAQVKRVVEFAVRLGCGVLKGPMVKKQVQRGWERSELDGSITVTEREVPRPLYEVLPTWDYYPDMSAKRFDLMEGEIHRHLMTRAQLSALRAEEGFDADMITEILKTHQDGNYSELTYEQELRELGTQSEMGGPSGVGHLYQVIEYWGTLPPVYVKAHEAELRALGLLTDDEIANESLRVALFAVAGHGIKIAADPFTRAHIFHKFIFEDEDTSLLGQGLPEVMRDSQLGVCAFARMLVNNASIAAGLITEINVALLDMSRTRNLTLHANKRFIRDDDTQAAQIPAVRDIRLDMHLNELLAGVRFFQEFADRETFVNPALMGDFSNAAKEPFRTAQGTSILSANASLPFKDVVRNFDNFTLSVISSLVEFNQMFNDKASLKGGDVQVLARGVSSLIAKEVRATSVDQFVTTLAPEEREFLKWKKLVEERAKVRDLAADDLILTDAEVQEQQARVQEQQARIDILSRERAEAEIRELIATAIQKMAQSNKANAQAQKTSAEIVKLTDDANIEALNTLAELANVGSETE